MARGFRADPDAAGDDRRTPLVDKAGRIFPALSGPPDGAKIARRPT